ncbi:unnamed protein product [Aureobasidium pullulans]|nr:unnamed protein product [Aureobasidium pullulans]
MSGEPDHVETKNKVKLEQYDHHTPHLGGNAHTDFSVVDPSGAEQKHVENDVSTAILQEEEEAQLIDVRAATISQLKNHS